MESTEKTKFRILVFCAVFLTFLTGVSVYFFMSVRETGKVSQALRQYAYPVFRAGSGICYSLAWDEGTLAVFADGELLFHTDLTEYDVVDPDRYRSGIENASLDDLIAELRKENGSPTGTLT